MAIDLRDGDDKIQHHAERFKVLREFGNLAVLDRETQLVWMRDAGTIGPREWGTNEAGATGAREVCAGLALGDRGGWRLPSLFELTSLADTSQSDPTLPAGHPFENVVGPYWTATTSARDDSLAWIVAFRATFGPNERPKNLVEFVWCVRGGTPGPDKY